jgi:tetratricopeptide (TPR) repeat protein
MRHWHDKGYIMRFVLALLLASFGAQAQSPQELFAKAEYAAAATAARAAGGAEGDGLAARATLTRAAYFTKDRQAAEALLDLALADARRGRARDQQAVEPLLQEGVALGYRAKLQQSLKIAKQARLIFERTLALDPKNGYAAMSMGAWNGEPIADVGGFLARTALGATQDKALKYYDLAMMLDPQNPVIPIFYAFNIYRIDNEKYGGKAQTLLEAATKLKPQDGFAAMLQKNAREVLASMQSGTAATTSRLIRLHQPFGAILVKK